MAATEATVGGEERKRPGDRNTSLEASTNLWRRTRVFQGLPPSGSESPLTPPPPGGGRKRWGRGGSGGREVAGQAASPAAGDRWSVNRRGGPTLPQPGACTRTRTRTRPGQAQDESAAAADRAPALPWPPLAYDTARGSRAGGPVHPAAWAPPGSEGPTAGRSPGAWLPGGGGGSSSSSCSSSQSDARRPAAAATPRAAPGDEPSRAPLRLPPCRLRPPPSVRTWSPWAAHGSRLPETGVQGQGAGAEARGPRGGGEQRKGASSGAAGS